MKTTEQEATKQTQDQPQSILGRLRSSFVHQEENDEDDECSDAPPSYTDDPPGPGPNPEPGPTYKTVYIRKVELILNGIPLDQVALKNVL